MSSSDITTTESQPINCSILNSNGKHLFINMQSNKNANLMKIIETTAPKIVCSKIVFLTKKVLTLLKK